MLGVGSLKWLGDHPAHWGGHPQPAHVDDRQGNAQKPRCLKHHYSHQLPSPDLGHSHSTWATDTWHRYAEVPTQGYTIPFRMAAAKTKPGARASRGESQIVWTAGAPTISHLPAVFQRTSEPRLALVWAGRHCGLAAKHLVSPTYHMDHVMMQFLWLSIVTWLMISTNPPINLPHDLPLAGDEAANQQPLMILTKWHQIKVQDEQQCHEAARRRSGRISSLRILGTGEAEEEAWEYFCRDAWFMVASATALYTSAGSAASRADPFAVLRRFKIYALWIVAASTIQPINQERPFFHAS